MENNAKVNSGRRQRYRHTPLAHIEATMLTVAGADFGAHQETYAVATDWHDTRLSQHHRYTSGQPLWSTTTTEHQVSRQETSLPVEQHGGEENDGPEPLLAPYLACARYKKGGEALSRLRNYLQRTDRAVRTVFQTQEHGACFLATTTPDAASVVSRDLESFGLWSFGAFPSVLKLAPGLLEHEDAHEQQGHSESHLLEAGMGGKRSRRENAPQSQQQHSNQPRKIEDLQRLTTIHGYTMRHDHVKGLNLELTPGILPASSSSEKSRDSPTSTTHAGDSAIDRSVAADALTRRLQDGLLSESLDLYGINFWSDRSMFDEHVERAGARALRARQWSRAARVVHFEDSVEGGEENGRIVPAGERCGWDSVRFHHAGDDLLLVLGTLTRRRVHAVGIKTVVCSSLFAVGI